MSKIDIISREWNDLVFEGRNKNYGGYILRSTSDKRHILALVIVLVVALVLFYSPKIFKILMPVGDKIETIDTEVELSDFDKPDEQIEEEKIPEVKQLQELRKTIVFTEFKAVDKKDIEVDANEKIFDNEAAISDKEQDGKVDYEIPPEVQPIVPVKAKDSVYVIVDQKADPPYDWQKYMQKSLRYPTAMQENGIQGRVTLQFVVSKTGKITNVKVVKSLDPLGDKEAIRVVESAPDWTPGKINGEPVTSLFTLPINFKLQ